MKFETRTELLPTEALQRKWLQLLNEKRSENDPAARERQFLFAHGWIVGLQDAGVISVTTKPDLVELLIAAKPDGC